MIRATPSARCKASQLQRPIADWLLASLRRQPPSSGSIAKQTGRFASWALDWRANQAEQQHLSLESSERLHVLLVVEQSGSLVAIERKRRDDDATTDASGVQLAMIAFHRLGWRRSIPTFSPPPFPSNKTAEALRRCGHNCRCADDDGRGSSTATSITWGPTKGGGKGARGCDAAGFDWARKQGRRERLEPFERHGGRMFAGRVCWQQVCCWWGERETIAS